MNRGRAGFAVALLVVSLVGAPAAVADERVKVRASVDRDIEFAGAGCGALDSEAVKLPVGARGVTVLTPRPGERLHDAVSGAAVAQVLSVLPEVVDDQPEVRTQVRGSDAACDPADELSISWAARATIRARYFTLERVHVTGTGRGGKRATKPRTLPFGTRSAVVKTRWRHWGGIVAYGRGQVEFNVCRPSCAESRPEYYPARVTLSRRRACGGYMQYRTFRLRYTTERRPPGRAPSYSETFPCV